MIARQKCTVYNVVFKLNVINFAEQLNNSVIAHHFTFIEKQVREWRKKKSSNSPKIMKLHIGAKISFDEDDVDNYDDKLIILMYQ